MIILTLFGTTTGLELINFPLTDNIPSLKFEDAWIGVTPSQVTLIPEKDACVVLRRSVGAHRVTWIGIYRPAREMGYDRPGSFYGAGAWIIDGVADAKLLVALLREMANQIQAVAMKGDQFIKKLANAKSQFTPPSLVPAIVASLEKISSGVNPEGESAFIVESANPADVIDWAQRASSADPFSKILIGSAGQVPSSGQSSVFRTFPSLSLAIDTTYQRLKFDSLNRINELTQSIGALQATNSKKDEEMKSVSSKLQESENSRDTLRAQAVGYKQKYDDLVNSLKPPVRLPNSGARADSRQMFGADAQPRFISLPPLNPGAGQVNSSGRSASGESPRGNVGLPQSGKQQPEDDHSGSDDWSLAIFVIVIVSLFALALTLYIGLGPLKGEGCLVFQHDCLPKSEPPQRIDPLGRSGLESSIPNGFNNGPPGDQQGSGAVNTLRNKN